MFSCASDLPRRVIPGYREGHNDRSSAMLQRSRSWRRLPLQILDERLDVVLRVERLLLAVEERDARLRRLHGLEWHAKRRSIARFGGLLCGWRFAQIESQQPMLTRSVIDQCELQDAKLGEPRFELHPDALLFGLARIEPVAIEHQGRMQRRQGMESVCVERDDGSGRVARTAVRACRR